MVLRLETRFGEILLLFAILEGVTEETYGSKFVLGCRGSEVQRLQDLLNRHVHPSPALKIDGIFGPRTEAAAKRYQQATGITVDGVIGSRTWGALLQGTIEDEDELLSLPPPIAGAPWLNIARREIGQKEMKGIHLNNPRILQYHAATDLKATTDEVFWCYSFVNWCMKETGIAGTNSAAAIDWVHWGKSSGPKVGAITVLRKKTGGNHVGFLLTETQDFYKLLGGNQGDQVKISDYYKTFWFALGYRWPSA